MIKCLIISLYKVPYKELSTSAGLVEMWGQIGMPTLQWFVAMGALAALIASMFGSMFPMPRVAYAMAKDELLCGY